MAVRPIRRLGDPVLRKKAEGVDKLGREIKELVRDLEDTLAEADGVGLAAPQIGVARRVFVMAPPVPEGEPRPKPRAYINPEFLAKEGAVVGAEEGCLSIPGIYETVKRPERVSIRAKTIDGQVIEETFEGIEARIIQHEMDHLDGVLFIDKIGPMRRALLKKRLRAFLE